MRNKKARKKQEKQTRRQGQVQESKAARSYREGKAQMQEKSSNKDNSGRQNGSSQGTGQRPNGKAGTKEPGKTG